MSDSRSAQAPAGVFFSGTTFWAAAAVLWTACILGMTVSPLSRMEWVLATLSDKTLHGIAFGLGAILWALALRPAMGSPWTPRLVGAAISFAIGGLVELLQKSVPGRQADAADFLANTIGILIALGLLLASTRYDKSDIKLK